MIINPFVWLTILGLIYLIGIVLFCVVTMGINKVFNMDKTVTFKILFIDCMFGALIGVVLAVMIFNSFAITDYTGNYPEFNTKLLQFCCILPTATIILKAIISFKKLKTG